jgi:DNA mismatch repair protein MLH1
LEKFEDLNSINTFGFRGEALASISHVSRLTITTKTAESACGFRASYLDGKMVKDIQPCAMSARGTQISVEDLFYNSPLRKNALKTSSDEFAKIYDVVARYAIHNYHCAFFLKRLGESGLDLKTLGCGNSSAKDNEGKALVGRCLENEKYLFDTITSIFGSLLKEKLEKVAIDFDERYRFEMQAYMTSAKLSTFILFINERLVDCQPLKKTLQNIFAQYLPKNEYMFTYINLKLDPNNLDVNVHPTKHEVF